MRDAFAQRSGIRPTPRDLTASTASGFLDAHASRAALGVASGTSAARRPLTPGARSVVG